VSGSETMSKSKTRAPDQTLEETKYLRHLAESQSHVTVKLSNNEEYTGRIEFFDSSFIRLTRADAPNLFIYKHDIKYLYEVDN
jgi:sRNA-binding regulator protein Hfq